MMSKHHAIDCNHNGGRGAGEEVVNVPVAVAELWPLYLAELEQLVQSRQRHYRYSSTDTGTDPTAAATGQSPSSASGVGTLSKEERRSAMKWRTRWNDASINDMGKGEKLYEDLFCPWLASLTVPVLNLNAAKDDDARPNSAGTMCMEAGDETTRSSEVELVVLMVDLGYSLLCFNTIALGSVESIGQRRGCKPLEVLHLEWMLSTCTGGCCARGGRGVLLHRVIVDTLHHQTNCWRRHNWPPSRDTGIGLEEEPAPAPTPSTRRWMFCQLAVPLLLLFSPAAATGAAPVVVSVTEKLTTKKLCTEVESVYLRDLQQWCTENVLQWIERPLLEYLQRVDALSKRETAFASSLFGWGSPTSTPSRATLLSTGAKKGHQVEEGCVAEEALSPHKTIQACCPALKGALCALETPSLTKRLVEQTMLEGQVSRLVPGAFAVEYNTLSAKSLGIPIPMPEGGTAPHPHHHCQPEEDGNESALLLPLLYSHTKHIPSALDRFCKELRARVLFDLTALHDAVSGGKSASDSLVSPFLDGFHLWLQRHQQPSTTAVGIVDVKTSSGSSSHLRIQQHHRDPHTSPLLPLEVPTLESYQAASSYLGDGLCLCYSHHQHIVQQQFGGDPALLQTVRTALVDFFKEGGSTVYLPVLSMVATNTAALAKTTAGTGSPTKLSVAVSAAPAGSAVTRNAVSIATVLVDFLELRMASLASRKDRRGACNKKKEAEEEGAEEGEVVPAAAGTTPAVSQRHISTHRVPPATCLIPLIRDQQETFFNYYQAKLARRLLLEHAVESGGGDTTTGITATSQHHEDEEHDDGGGGRKCRRERKLIELMHEALSGSNIGALRTLRAMLSDAELSSSRHRHHHSGSQPTATGTAPIPTAVTTLPSSTGSSIPYAQGCVGSGPGAAYMSVLPTVITRGNWPKYPADVELNDTIHRLLQSSLMPTALSVFQQEWEANYLRQFPGRTLTWLWNMSASRFVLCHSRKRRRSELLAAVERTNKKDPSKANEEELQQCEIRGSIFYYLVCAALQRLLAVAPCAEDADDDTTTAAATTTVTIQAIADEMQVPFISIVPFVRSLVVNGVLKYTGIGSCSVSSAAAPGSPSLARTPASPLTGSPTSAGRGVAGRHIAFRIRDTDSSWSLPDDSPQREVPVLCLGWPVGAGLPGWKTSCSSVLRQQQPSPLRSPSSPVVGSGGPNLRQATYSHRFPAVDACIVQLLKQKKKMHYNELQVALLSEYPWLDKKSFKLRLEEIMDRQFAQRCPEDRECIEYVA